MKAGWVPVLASGLAAVAIAACGSPSLPEQGECPPARTFTSSVLQDRAYIVTVSRQLDEIVELDAAFRARWTERRLRELDSFRQEYAVYAHETTCHARVIEDEPVPAALAPEIELAVQDYVTRLTEVMEDGRTAVASRNRSAYSDWVDAIDALIDEAAVLKQRMIDS